MGSIWLVLLVGVTTQNLNRNDRLLISIRCTLFSGIPLGKNYEVKRVRLGVVLGWVTDRKVDPWGARVRTKCAKECWYVRTIWIPAASTMVSVVNRWVWSGRYS